jgi:hypothetical protein
MNQATSSVSRIKIGLGLALAAALTGCGGHQSFSNAKLDQLLGPIALYPDPLIAEILPASTLPTQVEQADHFVADGGDPNQISQQPWDPSVQAVARYPDVLNWMDDNLIQTTELGEAFTNQQPAVMASIQRLRTTATHLGNLSSTPQQQVTNDDGNIEIDPADANELYVPVYQPDQVYDDSADGAPFITFGIGFPIGVWLDDDMDWGNDDIIVWNQDNPRPSNWWHESRSRRNTHNTTVWHPGNHHDTIVANHDVLDSTHAPSPAVTRQEVDHPASPPDQHTDSVTRTASTSDEHAEPLSHSAAASHPSADAGHSSGDHSSGNHSGGSDKKK